MIRLTFLYVYDHRQVADVVSDLTHSVHDQSITINELQQENLFASRKEIGSILQATYFDSILEQLHRLTGSPKFFPSLYFLSITQIV